MSAPETTFELVLRASVARKSICLVGSFATGQEAALKGLSGSVALDVTLSSLLKDLDDEQRELAELLTTLLGGAEATDVVLDRLAVAYTGEAKLAQLGFLTRAGANTLQFSLLYQAGSDDEPAQRERGFILGVELDAETSLPKSILSDLLGEISLGNVGLYYASRAFDDIAFHGPDDFRQGELLSLKSPAPGSRSFPKGLKVVADVEVDGVKLLDGLLQKVPSARTQAPPPAPVAPTPTPAVRAPKGNDVLAQAGETFWFETDKTLGPVSVRRVGLSYQDRRIGVKLDAGLKLSVLTVKLEGMGLSYPTDKLTTDPRQIWDNLSFHLDGASVALEHGPLAISGGLIKVPTPERALRLDGALLVQTPFFNLSALGSYESLAGEPSLFVFAALQRVLGGPPCFLVTGIALGFGINRALKLPAVEDVHTFPLVRAATDPAYLKDLDLRAVSDKLTTCLFAQRGNFWLAAGLRWTSFGQVESFALLTVSFGTQLELGLIGVSTIRVPKLPEGKASSVPAIACIELAYKVALTFETGTLSLEARLTERSFVLREEFKLRGGAAFFTWFSGPHEGDFVVSIGGYHPKFKLPAHYPRPDLVSFACTLGDAVSISGSCYFALCPSAVMAGGRLSIVYQSSWVHAWFLAHADFLVQWKPLYYDISLGVSVGVALRIEVGALRTELKLEVGAALDLYGPPLGGEARISLWIVTFTVKFGDARSKPPALHWDDDQDANKSFAKSFLPYGDQGCRPLSVRAIGGLLREETGGKLVHVSAHALSLSARSVIPATHVSFNGAAPQDAFGNVLAASAPRLGVRPMDKATFHSQLDVSVERSGQTSRDPALGKRFTCSPVTQSVPRALWGQPLSTADAALSEQPLISQAFVGLELRAKPLAPSNPLPPFELEALAHDVRPKEVNVPPLAPREPLRARAAALSIVDTVRDPSVVSRRAGIIGALRKQAEQSGDERRAARAVTSPDEVRLTELARCAPYLFQVMPVMAHAGQNPPRDLRDG